MQDVSGVVTFVGLDAHFERTTIKAVDRKGRAVLETEVKTSVRSLRAALRKLRGPVWCMMESSTMSFFVHECVEPVVDRAIVCETRENRWIAKSEKKTDPHDADRLARLLRMGEFQEVHVPARPRQEIRELVHAYQKAVNDVVRAKNRLNAKYRRHGIAVDGSLYVEERERGLAQIKRPNLQVILEAQYGILDAALEAREALAAKLHAILSHTKEYRLLCTIPGVGKIVAAIFVAVIDAPERFETKRKLWAYAGFGLRERWSGDPGKARKGGSKKGNRLLKYAALLAAKSAICGKNRFARRFCEMTANGIHPEMAKKTVARNILATARAMWMSGTAYRDDMMADAA